MRRTSSKVLASIVATAAAVAAAHGAASGAPGGQPNLGDAYARGHAALDRAGERLPEIAARYGLNPGELRRMLLDDATLAMDRGQRLAYFDEVEPADADALASPSGAASPEQAFALSSLPGADKTIYLDFDGHVTTGTTWNSQNNITSITSPPYDRDGNPSTFSTLERQIIADSWAVVAEDFAPWNVNVTTIDPGTDALRRSGSGDTRWGVRVVITGDDWNNCGCGGFAYLGSFDDSADEPAFVFNTSFAGVSEAISHEVGHTLLLNHDGLASGTTYYRGHSSSTTPGWAPIMGASYYQPVTQWSKQEYVGANNTGEDDTAIIGSLTNGNNFGLRADDHGDGAASATVLTTQQVDEAGLIGSRIDVDVFAFTTTGGAVSFNAYPADIGANLDIRLTLRDVAGNVVASDNGSAVLFAGFDANVGAGTYTVEVEGVGAGNPTANPPTGYTDYGSLGRYTMNGYIGGIDDPAPDTDPPAPPTGVVATEAGGDVTVSWTPNTEPDLATYSVRRAPTGSGPYVEVATVAAGTTSWSDADPAPGSYAYVVAATDTSGNTSAVSTPATVVVPAPDTQPPAAPTGVTATAVDGDVTVTWNANDEPDLASYAVRRATSATGPFGQIAAVPAGTTSYVDRGRAPGTWFYVVTATDTSGNTSPSSGTATVVVPEPPVDLSTNATGETPIAGTVSGTYVATTARGGGAQTITEVDSGGRPNRRHDLAEHRWTIPASVGNQTLTVVASASGGGDADSGFAVEYSHDGATWVPFATVAVGASIDVTEPIGVPTGSVFVRVIDDDRTQGNTSHDSITVDFLEVVGDGEDVQPPTATSVVASLTTSTQGAGRGEQYGVVIVTVNDDLGAAVAGATVTVVVSGSFGETLTGATNSSGSVTLRTNASAKKPTVVACVDAVAVPGLTYQPGTESC